MNLTSRLAFYSALASGLRPSARTAACGSSAASRLELQSHGEVRAADGFIFHQPRHGPVPPDLALLDDVGPVREPGRELEILLREHDGQALPLEGGDLLAEGLDDDGRQPFRRLVEEQEARVAHERARDGEHLLLSSREAPPSPPPPPAQPGEVLLHA